MSELQHQINSTSIEKLLGGNGELVKEFTECLVRLQHKAEEVERERAESFARVLQEKAEAEKLAIEATEAVRLHERKISLAVADAIVEEQRKAEQARVELVLKHEVAIEEVRREGESARRESAESMFEEIGRERGAVLKSHLENVAVVKSEAYDAGYEHGRREAWEEARRTRRVGSEKRGEVVRAEVEELRGRVEALMGEIEVMKGRHKEELRVIRQEAALLKSKHEEEMIAAREEVDLLKRKYEEMEILRKEETQLESNHQESKVAEEDAALPKQANDIVELQIPRQGPRRHEQMNETTVSVTAAPKTAPENLERIQAIQTIWSNWKGPPNSVLPSYMLSERYLPGDDMMNLLAKLSKEAGSQHAAQLLEAQIKQRNAKLGETARTKSLTKADVSNALQVLKRYTCRTMIQLQWQHFPEDALPPGMLPEHCSTNLLEALSQLCKEADSHTAGQLLQDQINFRQKNLKQDALSISLTEKDVLEVLNKVRCGSSRLSQSEDSTSIRHDATNNSSGANISPLATPPNNEISDLHSSESVDTFHGKPQPHITPPLASLRKSPSTLRQLGDNYGRCSLGTTPMDHANISPPESQTRVGSEDIKTVAEIIGGLPSARLDLPTSSCMFPAGVLRRFIGGTPGPFPYVGKDMEAIQVVAWPEFIRFADNKQMLAPSGVGRHGALAFVVGRPNCGEIGRVYPAVGRFVESVAQFQYLGHYEVVERVPVSVEEWKSWQAEFKLEIATEILESRWGKILLEGNGISIQKKCIEEEVAEVLDYFERKDKPQLQMNWTVLKCVEFNQTDYEKLVSALKDIEVRGHWEYSTQAGRASRSCPCLPRPISEDNEMSKSPKKRSRRILHDDNKRRKTDSHASNSAPPLIVHVAGRRLSFQEGAAGHKNLELGTLFENQSSTTGNKTDKNPYLPDSKSAIQLFPGEDLYGASPRPGRIIRMDPLGESDKQPSHGQEICQQDKRLYPVNPSTNQELTDHVGKRYPSWDEIVKIDVCNPQLPPEFESHATLLEIQKFLTMVGYSLDDFLGEDLDWHLEFQPVLFRDDKEAKDKISLHNLEATSSTTTASTTFIRWLFPKKVCRPKPGVSLVGMFCSWRGAWKVKGDVQPALKWNCWVGILRKSIEVTGKELIIWDSDAQITYCRETSGIEDKVFKKKYLTTLQKDLIEFLQKQRKTCSRLRVWIGGSGNSDGESSLRLTGNWILQTFSGPKADIPQTAAGLEEAGYFQVQLPNFEVENHDVEDEVP